MAKTGAGGWNKEWLKHKIELEKAWKKANPAFDAKKELGKLDKAVQELRKLDFLINSTFMAKPYDRGKFAKPFKKQAAIFERAGMKFLKDVKVLMDKDPAKAKLKKASGDFQKYVKLILTDIGEQIGLLDEIAEEFANFDLKSAQSIEKLKKAVPTMQRKVMVFVKARQKDGSVAAYSEEVEGIGAELMEFGGAVEDLLKKQKMKVPPFDMAMKNLGTWDAKAYLPEDGDAAVMKKKLTALVQVTNNLAAQVKKIPAVPAK